MSAWGGQLPNAASGGLEDKGCAQRLRRRNHRQRHVRRKIHFTGLHQPRSAHCGRELEADGREPQTLLHVGWFNAELTAIRRRVHDLDIAARRCDRHTERRRMQLAFADEGRQEDVMIGRILGDQHRAGDSADGVR